jgi:hypothetical protein
MVEQEHPGIHIFQLFLWSAGKRLSLAGQLICSDLLIKASAEAACKEYGRIHLKYRSYAATLSKQYVPEATNDWFRESNVVRFHLDRVTS